MAYLAMTQDVIKFMNSSFDKESLTSYQMLLVLFGKLFAEEEEFLKDRGDRMGLSHYVENFLRKNDFQTIVTIKDLNMIFNNNEPYDINDKELYKVFFVLIYEELSSNDPQISFKIKEAIFSLINQLQSAFDSNGFEDDATIPVEETHELDAPVEVIKNAFEEKLEPVPFFSQESPEVEFNNFEPPVVMKNNPIEDLGFQPMVDIPQPIDILPKNGPNLYPNLNGNEMNKNITFNITNKKYLRDFIQKKQLLPYQCAICGLSEWQNEPLYLELDSENGVYSSKDLNALRFLCPNCYSQVGHFD